MWDSWVSRQRSGLGADLGIPLSCWYELGHLMTVDLIGRRTEGE